jgi:hypothetical protein
MRARVSRHDEIKGPMGKHDCQNSKARELSAANGRSSRTTTPHSHHFCSPSPRITNLGQPTDCDFAPVAVSLADRAVEAFHIGRSTPTKRRRYLGIHQSQPLRLRLIVPSSNTATPHSRHGECPADASQTAESMADAN